MVDVSGDNYAKFCKAADSIKLKLKTINDDVKYHSSFQPTLDHPNYKELVAMGTKIIPYLFHIAISNGFNWTFILLFGDITGTHIHNPEHAGKFYHQTNDWITWYLNSTYYNNRPNMDVYYGLVD